MVKKICVGLIICTILCAATGCIEQPQPQPPTGNTSFVSQTQLTTGTSATSTVQSTNNGSKLTNNIPPTSSGITKLTTKSNSGDDKVVNNCKLIVKGKDITYQNHVKINHELRYVELPLTAVMKELGAEIKWLNGTTAKTTFKGKEYILNTIKCSFIEIGTTFNILGIAPGSKHSAYYQVVDNEFVIDSSSALLLVNNLMGAKIKIDYDKAIVTIY